MLRLADDTGTSQERPVRWRRLTGIVVAPASDGAICLDPTRVIPASADLTERPVRTRRLTIFVVAPADDGAVGLESKRVEDATADLAEGPDGDFVLPSGPIVQQTMVCRYLFHIPHVAARASLVRLDGVANSVDVAAWL